MTLTDDLIAARALIDTHQPVPPGYTDNGEEVMAREDIEPQARLIAALGETMHDQAWASDILARCAQIKQAVKEIERIATSRLSGER